MKIERPNVGKKPNTAKKQKTKFSDGKIDYIVKPDEKETTPGLFVSAGEIYEDFDKVTWKELLEDYTKMRNGGAIESTTVSILKYPIIRAGYTITHVVPEVVDYINWILDTMTDSFGGNDGFQEFLNHLFLGLEYGCSFFEKVYSSGVYTPDNKITNIISRLSPFKPETIWKFHYNDLMQFSGITHEKRMEDRINSFVDIPVEKLFFYSHNAEYGDPRGRSELRPIRNLFRIKQDILLATARAQQRGAGIPEIKILKKSINDSERANAHKVGKSIGNMKGSYFITDENLEVKLHSLNIQGTPEAILEFINREMFFNTLTEFMASGIGQNGSRSATSEHKGSYELKVGTVTQAMESKINLLLEEIIDISYLSGLKEYPKFKFNSMNQTDIVGAAQALNSFFTSNIIVKQAGDEQFIRGLFNLPEKELINGVEVVNSITPPKNVNNVTTVNKTGLSIEDKTIKNFSGMKFGAIKLSSSDYLGNVRKIFDVKETEDIYKNIQGEAEAIISDVVNKYIMYIAKQIDSGAEVAIKYDVELSNRLNKLYRDSYGVGEGAILKEMQKISNNKSLALSAPKVGDVVKTSSQSIERFAGRLIFNIKTVVEDVIDSEWEKTKGSATEYIISKNFEEGFKTDRRTLISKTVDGYLDGRGEAISQNSEKIELYFYNSIMDMNLCNNCAALTGSVMTLDEAKEQGLLIKGCRVNPDCAGGLMLCRCNLVPYKLKGDFII